MNISDLYVLYKNNPILTTDSRNVPQGSVFLALKGASFNGNLFALAALEQGARYAIVDEMPKEIPGGKGYEERLILVDDALQTLKDLAREHRRQFRIPVVGITGTNGKTTTKELIAAVLREKYCVLCTEGNFNNDVGVPKTLFRLAPEHEIAVVEMGASHPGDIRTLVETAEPDCGLITNVGRAHLEGFGSFEGVKQTKGELYDFLAANHRFAFINTADADLSEMAAARNLQTRPYAQGEIVSCAPLLKMRIASQGASMEIQTRLIGSYNAPNVLAAVTVGRAFGVADEQIRHALENYTPSNNRSQLTLTEKNHLVVDAYNANPTSMAAAIENFRLMEVEQKKMAILGEMRELGADSSAEHQKVLTLLREAQFDEVWLVGREFAALQPEFRCFLNVDEVKAALEASPIAERFILIKGSNGTKLFQLPEKL